MGKQGGSNSWLLLRVIAVVVIAVSVVNFFIPGMGELLHQLIDRQTLVEPPWGAKIVINSDLVLQNEGLLKNWALMGFLWLVFGASGALCTMAERDSVPASAILSWVKWGVLPGVVLIIGMLLILSSPSSWRDAKWKAERNQTLLLSASERLELEHELKEVYLHGSSEKTPKQLLMQTRYEELMNLCLTRLSELADEHSPNSTPYIEMMKELRESMPNKQSER